MQLDFHFFGQSFVVFAQDCNDFIPSEVIGQFAALGIAFSFLFVHTVFPLIFPVMPPPKKKRSLPIQGLVSKLALKGGKYKAFGALAFALFSFCAPRLFRLGFGVEVYVLIRTLPRVQHGSPSYFG